MTDRHEFDRDYWEQHWGQTQSCVSGGMDADAPHPYLVSGTSGLTPGTALDAGCGAGGEAIWLAAEGWDVTAADISVDALARAARRASAAGVSGRVRWVEADLTTWSPDAQLDLVTTHYAHPAMPQLAFYQRISEWVAPGGTLLIVGHLHSHDSTGHGHQGHQPPPEAEVTVADVTDGLDDTRWEIVTAQENLRTVAGAGGQPITLCDVVVQAARRR